MVVVSKENTMTIILDTEDFEWLKVLANHVPDDEDEDNETRDKKAMAYKLLNEATAKGSKVDMETALQYYTDSTSYQHIRRYEQPC